MSKTNTDILEDQEIDQLKILTKKAIKQNKQRQKDQYVPLSSKYPVLLPLIKRIKIAKKNIQYISPRYTLEKSDETEKYTFKVKKHKSILRRKLGNVDLKLQESKVKNLEIASHSFNNLLIKPNQIFSFWKNLGNPSKERGFVDGLLISNSKPTKGIGGGLCQAANLLYWLFLHTELEPLEHHHHSVDLFPDSGRVLPFGSGASVLYNYGDLQFVNKTQNTYLLKVWLDEENLHGEIYTDNYPQFTYKIKEKYHHFYSYNDTAFRYNELNKIIMLRQGGILQDEILITINNSKVMYPVDPEKILYTQTD